MAAGPARRRGDAARRRRGGVGRGAPAALRWTRGRCGAASQQASAAAAMLEDWRGALLRLRWREGARPDGVNWRRPCVLPPAARCASARKMASGQGGVGRCCSSPKAAGNCNRQNPGGRNGEGTGKAGSWGRGEVLERGTGGFPRPKPGQARAERGRPTKKKYKQRQAEFRQNLARGKVLWKKGYKIFV